MCTRKVSDRRRTEKRRVFEWRTFSTRTCVVYKPVRHQHIPKHCKARQQQERMIKVHFFAFLHSSKMIREGKLLKKSQVERNSLREIMRQFLVEWRDEYDKRVELYRSVFQVYACFDALCISCLYAMHRTACSLCSRVLKGIKICD